MEVSAIVDLIDTRLLMDALYKDCMTRLSTALAIGIATLGCALSACGHPPTPQTASPQSAANQDDLIAEYTGKAINVFDLAAHSKYVWALPDPIATMLSAPGRMARMAWSPASHTFLFVSPSGDFLLQMDGTVSSVVTGMPASVKSFDGTDSLAISYRGRSIAYYSDESGHFGLSLRHLKDSGVKTISLDFRPFALAWSPDGGNIALGEGDGLVTVMSMSGVVRWSTQIRSGDSVAGQPNDAILGLQWQPTGETVAALDNGGLYRINADGSNVSRVSTPKSYDGKELQITTFSWSPDGQRLAFRAVTSRKCHFAMRADTFKDCTAKTALYVVNSDGSAIHPVAGGDSDTVQQSTTRLFWIKGPESLVNGAISTTRQTSTEAPDFPIAPPKNVASNRVPSTDLEAMADHCSTNSFEKWMHSVPPLQATRDSAAMQSELRKKCRAALDLPDIPPYAIELPKPGQNYDRADGNKRVLASICESDAVRKLDEFWKQNPDQANRSSRLKEIRQQCLMEQGIPDSEGARSEGNQ